MPGYQSGFFKSTDFLMLILFSTLIWQEWGRHLKTNIQNPEKHIHHYTAEQEQFLPQTRT